MPHDETRSDAPQVWTLSNTDDVMYIVTTVHGLHSINGRGASRRTQLVRVNLSLLRVACKTERGWHSLNMVLCDVGRQWACSLSQARVGARRAVVGDAATDTLLVCSPLHRAPRSSSTRLSYNSGNRSGFIHTCTHPWALAAPRGRRPWACCPPQTQLTSLPTRHSATDRPCRALCLGRKYG